MKALGEEERLALLNRLAIISSKRRKSPFFAGKRVAPLEGVLSKAQLQRVFYIVSLQTKIITARLDYTLVT
jgi:hypothetical protein